MILDNQMSSALCVALKDAVTLAQRHQQTSVEIEHVLLSILAQEGNVLQIFRSNGIEVNYLIRRLERDVDGFPKTFNKDAQPAASSKLEQALQFGLDNAQSNARQYCETHDFVAGVTRVPSGSAPVMLRSYNFTVLSVQGAALRLKLASEPVNTAPSPFSYGFNNQNTAFGSPAAPFGAPNQPATAFGTPQPTTAFGAPVQTSTYTAPAQNVAGQTSQAQHEHGAGQCRCAAELLAAAAWQSAPRQANDRRLDAHGHAGTAQTMPRTRCRNAPTRPDSHAQIQE